MGVTLWVLVACLCVICKARLDELVGTRTEFCLVCPVLRLFALGCECFFQSVSEAKDAMSV